MSDILLDRYAIDHIEIYAPMAKALAYWHVHALGFTLAARSDDSRTGTASYVLDSGDIRLVITSSYPMGDALVSGEAAAYIFRNYCGVKKVALRVHAVPALFGQAIALGAIPLRAPVKMEDAHGAYEEASIKLYDNSEIVFVDRGGYNGIFKPGYEAVRPGDDTVRPGDDTVRPGDDAVSRRYDAVTKPSGDGGNANTGGYTPGLLKSIDHIASEVRVNAAGYWTNYLTRVLGTRLVQQIQRGSDNHTGMILNINQTRDNAIVFVIAEPDNFSAASKVGKNVATFGPGIHHLAFATDDLIGVTNQLLRRGVEFVPFPSSYYDILEEEHPDMDIRALRSNGILLDREGDSYLLQKFLKPISDRPFFLYELVQRVNGYSGFALKNINTLKKAEEREI